MLHRSLSRLLSVGLLACSCSLAGPIYVGPVSTSALGQTFVFDLASTGQLAGLNSNAIIQTLSTAWSFSPGIVSTQFLELGGTLEFEGIDSGLTFSEIIDLADPTGAVAFSQNNGGASGISVSSSLVNALITGDGKLNGKLVPTAGTEDNWQTFFDEGGVLSNIAFFQIKFRPKNPDPGSDPVPEPQTVLIWAALGVLGIGMIRRHRNSAPRSEIKLA